MNHSHAEKLKVLAFGDSLTAGYRVPLQKSYPAVLQELLKAQGKQVEIVNSGVSGDTTADGLRRVEWSLKQGPFQWVLLCLGANDGLRNLPLEQTRKNLREILLKFQKSGAKVALLGMKMPSQNSLKYQQEFAKIYSDLAKEFKLPFYEFFLAGVAESAELNLIDQIHPNERGYRLIAERLAKFLAPHL